MIIYFIKIIISFIISSSFNFNIIISIIFQQTPYFMSEEFGLVDCYVAPLLWKLRNMGVEFSGTGSKAIKGYMDRVFSRDSFLQSVGEATPKNLMDDK